MPKLNEFNGHYCESEFEYAFIGLLEQEGWNYLSGNNMLRSRKREVVYNDDLAEFLIKSNPDLTIEEVQKIVDAVRLVGAENDFATLHKVYGWMVDGVQFVANNGQVRMMPLINYDDYSKNIFRVVNQLPIEYTNNGKNETRRPDVLLYFVTIFFKPRFTICLFSSNNGTTSATVPIAAKQEILSRTSSSLVNN